MSTTEYEEYIICPENSATLQLIRNIYFTNVLI